MKYNCSFFKNIIFINSIDSTNTLLKTGDYPDKTVCYTFDQTKGRGREERPWLGFENKNLAFSFLLTGIELPSTLWFVAAASLALTDILERNFSLKGVWIKWPNDVYISDKKIAGVLAETVIKENKIEKLVVGIGININCSAGDFTEFQNNATSVLIETGNTQDMNNFFSLYLDGISIRMEKLLNNKDGISMIKEEWIGKCKIIGKDIEWNNAGKILAGKAEGVTDEGFLLLKINSEIVKAVSGEIKVVKT